MSPSPSLASPCEPAVTLCTPDPCAVIYLRNVSRQHPITILYAFFIFACLLAASLWAVLEFAWVEEYKAMKATENMAKDLSRFFTRNLDSALFYAYSLSTFAVEVPEVSTFATNAPLSPFAQVALFSLLALLALCYHCCCGHVTSTDVLKHRKEGRKTCCS